MSQKRKMWRVRPLSVAVPRLKERPPPEPGAKPRLKPKEVRTIERRDNDEFRRALTIDQVLTTEGVSALGTKALNEVIRRVQLFDHFDPNNRKCRRETGTIGYRGEAIVFAVIPNLAGVPDDVTFAVGYPRQMVIRLACED